MFDRLQADLARGHWPLVELHACRAIPLNLVLDPHEDFGIHRLRAGVTAEQAAGNGGEQEQRIGRDDQQQREIENILRPQDQAKQIELALYQMHQNRLTPIPFEPRGSVEQDLCDPHQNPAPGIPPALDVADIYLFVLLVKRDGNRGGLRCLVFGVHCDYIRIEITLIEHCSVLLRTQF